ncbi:IclR family transcriptional regulator [Cupriavidus sp. 2TAF22]|uniref:IclR family transcriptional regulator n=1 Tax=unclassified Cupriavidus TaxID=2640874 RepID=UPI003F8EEAB6
MVAPLARSLAVLSAFTPEEQWLGNQEISAHTGIPAPTVSRMLHSLVTLGYLRYSRERRKYRLSAAVLSLGYGAIAHRTIHRLARVKMQAFADASQTFVVLAIRDRLDLIVLATCTSQSTAIDLRLPVGTRLHIASSPLGWALLASLPELERFYLLGNVERKMARDWPRLRRRIGEGISETLNSGFCTSIGEWEPELGVVATPVNLPGHAPLVIACIGPGARMSRARTDRELGPRLAATAHALQEEALFAT